MNRFAPIVLSSLLAGCALTSPPKAEIVMRVDPPVPPAAAPAGTGLIALSPVTARGTAAERRYVYIDPASPGEVHQAATLFWEEPPPRLVERALARGLTARLGIPVLAAEQAPGAERRLTVRVDRFEEHAGASATALVALDATVVGASPRTLTLDKRYCATAPIADASPSRRAAAFEAALGAAMDQMAGDLAQPSTTKPSTC